MYSKEDTPRVVSVTYVSVKELEAQATTTDSSSTPYTRLSVNDSIGSDDGMMIEDTNLLQMRASYGSSDDEDDVINSSDEERY